MAGLRTAAVALVAPLLPILALASTVAAGEPVPTIVAITASGGAGWDEGHTCALTSAGAVLCWGENKFGQLGDGTTVHRASPVLVKGLSGPVVAIAAGGLHTCALTVAGGVECWGNNVNGQLGDGTGKDSLSPVHVSGLGRGVKAIASGEGQVCALTSGGAVKCWGMLVAGAHTDTGDSLVPLDIKGLGSGVRAIATGTSHTCAITSRGGVKCWGIGAWGQLGDGKTAEQPVPISETPVDVVRLDSGVVAIAAGDAHTCAVTTRGAVKCWGGNLANGAEHNSDVPFDVTGLGGGTTRVATTYWHTCVLTSNGEIECWGTNDRGQLGDGTAVASRLPIKVTAVGHGNVALATGGFHTCVVTSTAQVECWGANGFGQLGDGTTTDRLTPVEVVVPLSPSPQGLPATATSAETHEGSGQPPALPLLVGLAALVLLLRRPPRRLA
jgi:alpha-tubulin suppressor-like RCC1 family protein